MAQFNVTELDFDKIKASIKDHFRSQTQYNDWDFDGSGLSTLLDILAYNTHYNAMVAHFSLNETFLDSAQIRGNVVSHAKLLGYTPKSTAAPTAILNLVVTPGLNPPASIEVTRGTRFTTSIDGTAYPFVVISAVEASLLSGTYSFNTANSPANPVYIKQGVLKRMVYRVDNAVENQKFEIPEVNVDTSTLRVRIKENESSTQYETYTKFSTLSGVTAASTIYFTQENASGKFEVYFGDGYIGKKPFTNNIVEIEYVYTDGTFANGASVFIPADTIGGYSNIAVTTSSNASGGAARETIESIRYNAPLTFVSQNRAVTADDYKAIISKEFGAIDSISVWGGENAIEPDFGKVFISIKPSGKDLLSDAEKQQILNVILSGKNVVSIRPFIVDPEYTYITLEVFFKYNPNLTDRSRIELQGLVRDTIQTYANENLQKFDGVFRYSNLLKNIDSSDPAILNSDARVYMYKYAVPRASGTNYFDLQFSSPIYQTTSSSSVLSSTIFKIGGIDHELGDVPKGTTTDRIVYLYKYVGGVRTAVRAVGAVYATTGQVVINGVQPDTTDPIRITVIPNSNDLAPKRNQLLDIDLVYSEVTGEVDTIAVGGSAGAVSYTTPSRHRSGS
jgi:hypothetical protein